MKFQKLSDYRIENPFVRKQLDQKPASPESNSNDIENPNNLANPCPCSTTATQNQELLSKILLKLNALEEQISDISRSVKNNSNDNNIYYFYLYYINDD